jgi:hypothetical protein
MKQVSRDPRERVRIVIGSGLALCALALAVIDLAAPNRNYVPARNPEDERIERQIGSAIDTLFARYGISRSSVRTTNSVAEGQPTGRVQKRVEVGRSFLSLSFNHDLDAAVRGLDAHVVATERSAGSTVIMHIVRRGRTVCSIVFLEKPDD